MITLLPASCCLPHICGESSGEEQNWPHGEREGGRGLDGQLQPFYSAEVTWDKKMLRWPPWLSVSHTNRVPRQQRGTEERVTKRRRIKRERVKCVFELRGSGEYRKYKKQENENDTRLCVCVWERLRKCDKAAELMSERGRVNVLGGVREGKRGRGGGITERKRSVCAPRPLKNLWAVLRLICCIIQPQMAEWVQGTLCLNQAALTCILSASAHPLCFCSLSSSRNGFHRMLETLLWASAPCWHDDITWFLQICTLSKVFHWTQIWGLERPLKLN